MAARLTGPDRTLDALIGPITVIASLCIGYVARTALFQYGVTASGSNPSGLEVRAFGWMTALIGCFVIMLAGS